MITDRFIKYLKENCVAYTLGTRDANLSPSIEKPAGLTVSDDRTEITIYLPEGSASQHLKNLEDNGRVALTVAAIPSFESYQFKGSFISAQECTPEDIQIMRDWLNKFSKGCTELGYPQSMVEGMNNHILDPGVKITFKVEEIYEQSPKPGTGDKIS